MKRRDFVRTTSLTVAAAYAQGSGAALLRAASATPFAADADVGVTLTAKRRRVRIFPGARTNVWSYGARLVSGPPEAMARIPRSYLGPVLRVHQGQRLRVDVVNRLAEETTVHWHGMHVPSDMDGHPKNAIPAGGRRTYEFDVLNRAGTYWFHPHPHGRTAEQVYNGLAGMLIVHDDEELALGLPDGDRDLPVVIQDRRFDSDNQLIYRSGIGMAGGMLGNQVLVNGRPDASLAVRAEPYRLRLLNGSNSRIFKIAWTDANPLQVIGTDGGLLDRPVERGYVTLAPGERVELWVDFRDWGVGASPALTSTMFQPGHAGLGGPGAGMPDQGDAMDLMEFRITEAGTGSEALPKRLSRIRALDPTAADNAENPRTFVFAGGPAGGGFWAINGRTFEMEAVADDERVAAGSMEVWEFSNPGTIRPGGGMGPGGNMMSTRMPHPVHVHGSSFQVLERSVQSGGGFHDDWMTMSEGYVDEGWKDTVLLMPGETVRVIRRFDDFRGLYLIHCHNLEHEDAGMMRNFVIE